MSYPVMGGLRTLLGGKAQRFGTGPAVVISQRLTESTGARRPPVRWQISQRVTGSWVTVTGNGEEIRCSFGSVMPAPLG